MFGGCLGSFTRTFRELRGEDLASSGLMSISTMSRLFSKGNGEFPRDSKEYGVPTRDLENIGKAV